MRRRIVALTALVCVAALASAPSNAEDLVSVSRNPATLFFRATDTPTCPPAGTRGIYYDTSAGELYAINSACVAVSLEGAGGAGAPTTATYITQTPDAGLSAEQAMSLLATGIVKNTTATGVLSIAVAGDFPTLNQSTTGNAATATALAADPANCVAGSTAGGILASGVAEACIVAPVNTAATASQWFTAYTAATGAFTKAQPAFTDISGSVTDAQVPDTITLTNLTQIGTRLISDTTGILTVARGGTGAAPAGDDQILTSDSAVAATWRTLADCVDTTGKHLNYTAATNTWSCGTTGTTNALLDGVAHSDTRNRPVVRGALIVGNSTPSWDTLPIGTSLQQMRVNVGGTDPEWFTPTAAPNSVTQVVTVTSAGTYFTQTVTATWVLAGTEIVCRPFGAAVFGSVTATPESVIVSGVQVTATAISAGVGFTVVVNNPNGLEGAFEVHCVGI